MIISMNQKYLIIIQNNIKEKDEEITKYKETIPDPKNIVNDYRDNVNSTAFQQLQYQVKELSRQVEEKNTIIKKNEEYNVLNNSEYSKLKKMCQSLTNTNNRLDKDLRAIESLSSRIRVFIILFQKQSNNKFSDDIKRKEDESKIILKYEDNISKLTKQMELLTQNKEKIQQEYDDLNVFKIFFRNNLIL